MVEELKSMVGMDETILYEGKPDKKCFIFESIFNPLLPVAIYKEEYACDVEHQQCLKLYRSLSDG